MVDVRNVVLRLDVLGLLAIVALVVAGFASRGAAWFWRAVSIGATTLAVGVVAIGIAFALFFDAAFELMHELFFPAGSYTFDPRTERLVQLFPYTFWTETTIVIAIVGVAAAGAVAFVARSRVRRLDGALGAPVGVARQAGR
jgi:integral membrane protein (TIGR01906 family)